MNAPDNRDGFAGTGATLEQVTFCKTQGPNDGAAGAGDPKRPDQVILSDESALEMCPTDSTKPVDELTDALPEAWFARIQFDELLDPSIEDLVPNVDASGAPDGTYTGTLKNTQPVTLKCESSTGSGLVDVPYDGYYSPAGNSISYPLGPSLVIKPNDPTVIATNSECQVTIKDIVKDKDGNQVPADQKGPYKFKIAPIQVLVIDPTSADSKQDPVAAGVDLTFNTAVSKASLAGAAGPPVVPAAYAFAPDPGNDYVFQESAEEFFIGGDFPSGGGPFVFTIKSGAMLTDQCGKATTFGAPSVDALTQTSLTTNALKLGAIAGAVEPGNKISITFNQYMDPASLLAAEYTITPALANADVEPSGDLTKLLINGDFQLGTAYTFTLKSGATIDDCPGGEIGSCVKSATYTAAADMTTMFTTAAAITLKSIAPKDNTSETVATAETSFSKSGIRLTFNQEIDPASFDATDYTISPPLTLTATNLGGPGGGSSYEVLELDPPNAGAGTPPQWPPGTYTFTLKSTAVLKDKLGNSFSPSTDQVIHLTVTPNPTPTPHTCL